MVRLTISAISVLCCALLSLPAIAADFGASGAAVQSASTSAARLYALGITTRAQGSVGQGSAQAGFTPPPMPPMPSAAAPPAIACGSAAPGPSGSTAGLTSVANGGMRFMPLHHDAVTHTLAMPQRREIVPSAEALRVAVAGSKNTSDLAQVALQAANAPSPQSQAQTELASLTGNSAAAPANPTAVANEQVLAQIQRYRNAHSAW